MIVPVQRDEQATPEPDPVRVEAFMRYVLLLDEIDRENKRNRKLKQLDGQGN